MMNGNTLMGYLDSLLWMFGEDAQSCNWKLHTRMIPNDTTDTRYSIIFDLQGRTYATMV